MPGALLVLGNICASLGWTNEALAQYQEILNRDPNSAILPIVERNVGIVLLAQGKYGQALSHLNKSLELAPQFALEQTHYWIGKALVGQGKLKEAESEFQKSIEFSPNSKFAADSAAEIEDTRGTTDASHHPQSNRVVVVVSLAVQNGKNGRLGGQVVE